MISNTMKKSITTSIIASICLLALISLAAPAVWAQGPQQTNNPPAGGGQQTNNPSTTFTLQNPLHVDSIGALIENFVQIFSYIVILFAVLAFVWVGLQYILARGKPERMKELSSWLLYIVIGVAVVLGAQLMIRIVINTLSATGAVDQRVIKSANDAIPN